MMKKDEQMAEQFAKDEDRFLKPEFDAMCEFFKSGECPEAQMRAEKMRKMHDKMTKKYGMEFEHHKGHIDMMEKKCKGNAPSKDMKGKMKCKKK